jgi:hypothetical protein
VSAISQAVASGDQLLAHSAGPACSEKAWPYYESNCVRDLRRSRRRRRYASGLPIDFLPIPLSLALIADSGAVAVNLASTCQPKTRRL